MSLSHASAQWPNRGTQKFSVAFIGDSVTEGQASSTPMFTANKRYVDIVRLALQARNLNGIVGGQGAFGHFFGSAANTPWTYGGTALSASSQPRFAMDRSVNLAGGGTPSTATITMGPMTSLDVYFWQGSAATLPFTVTINGNVNTVTPSTTGGLINNGVVNLTNGVNTGANNTIVYTGNAGGISYPSGQGHRNGDETAGVRTLELGHFGYTSTTYINSLNTDNNSNGLAPMMPILNPDLYVICLGLNDYQAQVATATFASNISSIIAACKAWASGFTPSFLLVSMYVRQDIAIQPITMAQYASALQGVSSGDTANTVFFDLAPVFAGNYGTYLNADNLHPNDAGHAAIGNALAPIILGSLGGAGINVPILGAG